MWGQNDNGKQTTAGSFGSAQDDRAFGGADKEQATVMIVTLSGEQCG
jgi:hypothetical protein